MATSSYGINELPRIGGVLCLDFTNTIGWRGRQVPNEWLVTYADLIQWSRNVGLLTESDTAELVSCAQQSPDKADQALEAARTLREELYEIFSALAEGNAVPKPALDELNRRLSHTLGNLWLAGSDTSFQWQWRHEAGALDHMLDPIVHSAAELLTSSHLSRLKACANDGCAWLFVDTSRNHRRRWCDMRECGNRVKVRRHYQRWKR